MKVVPQVIHISRCSSTSFERKLNEQLEKIPLEDLLDVKTESIDGSFCGAMILYKKEKRVEV